MFYNMPTEIENYILSFLCKYCNKLKYLNKEFYDKFQITEHNYFSKHFNKYKFVFKTILNTSFFQKCFHCYYIDYDSLQLLFDRIYYKMKNKITLIDSDFSIYKFDVHINYKFSSDKKKKRVINDIYKILSTSEHVNTYQYCCGKNGIMFSIVCYKDSIMI